MIRARADRPAASYACLTVPATILSLLLGLAFVVFATMSLASAVHAGESRDAATRLTRELTDLDARYRGAPARDRAQLAHVLVSTAARRQQLLSSIIESDPGAVLQAAIPAELRRGLAPEVQPYLEEEMDAQGELEVLYEDYIYENDDDEHRLLHFLNVDTDQRLSLHFAAQPPALETGTHVRVRGIRVGRALALEPGGTSVEAIAAVAPNTFGEQRTVVILVNFQDKPNERPYSRDYARDVVFNTTSQFFWEASYRQTWVTGDVVGWYTVPMNSTTCDGWTLASHARSAATAAGVDLAAYTRYVYAFPSNACVWWGTGTVGGNPSHAWVNGTLVFQVVGHEMGHNLGLFHSRALDCGSTTIGSNCTTDEYGDTLDVMGFSTGHYNAFQKERLGWLNFGASPPITTVEGDGTYWLDAYETPGSNAKALKIPKATDPTTGKKTWYYLEHRQAIGFDGFVAGNSNVLNGVVVHIGSELAANSSNLLDMTPATASWSDPALTVGKSFTDPDAGVTIATTWASNGTAAVAVTFGSGQTAPACAPASPTVTASPSQSPVVAAGTTVSYSVSVTNNDSAACSAASFSLQATAPTGWSATFTTSTLTLSPGGRASTTLQVTSPTSATGGAHQAGVTARNAGDPGYAAATSVTYNVASPLEVSVTTSPSSDALQSYSVGQKVQIVAVVADNGAPVNRASVTFTITKPNGSVVTRSLRTGTTGLAVYRFKVGTRDPVGIYQVRADAALNQTRTGSGTTTFLVR